jgi:uncharacterized membrane protein YsdA (DUF1294 family)
MVFSYTCWKIIFGWNIVVAIVYGWDKFLSVWTERRKRRRYFLRVSENLLLLLLFAFGPVGAWLAMEGLRHKTRKSNFRIRAILLTVLNPLWLIFYWTIKA